MGVFLGVKKSLKFICAQAIKVDFDKIMILTPTIKKGGG
jgi:hypothetical protein